MSVHHLVSINCCACGKARLWSKLSYGDNVFVTMNVATHNKWKQCKWMLLQIDASRSSDQILYIEGTLCAHLFQSWPWMNQEKRLKLPLRFKTSSWRNVNLRVYIVKPWLPRLNQMLKSSSHEWDQRCSTETCGCSKNWLKRIRCCTCYCSRSGSLKDRLH